MAQKPWEHSKTAGSEGDPLAARFVASIDYDWRLYKQDIAGSIAHAKMLESVDLINAEERKAIEKGLKSIQKQIDRKGRAWPGFVYELEDIHMCIEAALIDKIGEPARKLHTGRSRNDQVATDLLLWLREASDHLAELTRVTIAALLRLAERDGWFVMPAYTHLQRAQPIVVGGELLAWADALERVHHRFHPQPEYWDRCPLGSGAVAGSSLPLDRKHTADALNGDAEGAPDQIVEMFQGMFGLDDEQMASIDQATSMTRNAIDATASRDAALDFVFAAAMAAMTLSRWAEQWIIYSSTEFGFITVEDAYTTGSSMMPQKQNPDMLELIRGKAGSVYGSLVALLTTLKGLPIGYNRDLQEDKRHVFQAYDDVRDCLEMTAKIVAGTSFNESRIKEGLDRGFLDATSLAEYLVTRGVPFRTSHQIVGAMVALCRATDKYKLEQLTLDEMKEAAARHEYGAAIGKDVFDWLGPENVVKRYQTFGNAGVSGFEQQLEAWQERLG